MVNWPARFEDVDALEEFMTRPNADLERELAGIDEIMVLGIGGKMGPTLARLARRAGKRVIGVARFSEKGLREKLEGWLNIVRAMWPECPARIDDCGRALWVEKAAAVRPQE